MYDTIYHNECCCFHADNVMDDDCHKRMYPIFDWKSGETKLLFVCNEFIRCRINNLRAEQGRRWPSQYAIENVIRDIIKEHVEVGGPYGHNENDLVNRTISFEVCERPWLPKRVLLVDAIEQYLKGDFYASHLYEKIKEEIIDYMDKLTYKKYKTKYQSVKSKLNKIRNTYTNEGRVALMNEVITEIFETQYKLNNKK